MLNMTSEIRVDQQHYVGIAMAESVKQEQTQTAY